VAPRVESTRAGSDESDSGRPHGRAAETREPGGKGSSSKAEPGEEWRNSDPPADPDAPEGFLRETFRRVLETGARSLTAENIRQAARELRLPKEVLQHLLNQVEEGKSAFYKAAAEEVRGFLERSNLAEEIAKALTRLTFEAKLEVRFKPSEGAAKRAVSGSVGVVPSSDAPPSGSRQDNDRT
jgi:hypothetical protein